MTDLQEQLIEDIVGEGELDWISFATIGNILRQEGHPAEGLHQRAVEIAVELVRRGLLVPGRLTDDGFEAWSVPISAAIETIEHETRAALQQFPQLAAGQVCWFDITDEAQRRYLDGDTDSE